MGKPLPRLQLVKARQTEPRQGTASKPASQGRALQARWQSQARQHSLQEQQHSRLQRLCGGFAAAVVVLAESVAWLGSATSPGVLCLGLAGSPAVPCLGSVCLVLTWSKRSKSGKFLETTKQPPSAATPLLLLFLSPCRSWIS